jgi:hypothetical protein
LRWYETVRYVATTIHEFARVDADRESDPLLGSPGRNGPPPATPPHRGWIVAKNVATLTKAIGLLLGVATLAVLAAVIIAGTIIGLGLLVIG